MSKKIALVLFGMVVIVLGISKAAWNVSVLGKPRQNAIISSIIERRFKTQWHNVLAGSEFPCILRVTLESGKTVNVEDYRQIPCRDTDGNYFRINKQILVFTDGKIATRNVPETGILMSLPYLVIGAGIITFAFRTTMKTPRPLAIKSSKTTINRSNKVR